MFPTSWSYIAEALGGLALFILGMRTMSEGLQKVTGERLRRVLERTTGNRLTAPLVGSCLASILQSGSAASVLVVGFVNAGLLSLYQALGVLLGTGIGTTLAIQFIAFASQPSRSPPSPSVSFLTSSPAAAGSPTPGGCYWA